MLRRRSVAWLALCAPALPSAAAERLEIRLSEHLGLADLRLAGARAARLVEFQWPLDWRPQPGGELRLRFEHSPALDGERSFLAVSLNHGVLRSVRLEAANAAPTELVVPLPPLMLREENQLTISVEQFATSGAAKDAWTVVSADSSIAVPFERRRVVPSLSDLPEPLLRRRSYEPRRLTVLLPTRPSLETLEATARSLAGLASRVAPAQVQLAFARSFGEARTPVLAVGTAREQPALRELGELEGAASAGAGTGIVALEPRAGPSEEPALVITGTEPAAVSRAALGLFGPRRKGSRLLLVSAAPERRSAAPREWRSFMPPANGFALHEAGDPRPELAVTADLPARVRLEAPPDARFLPYGHRVTLVFETLPGLASDPKADLEVYWNDVLLRRASMEQYARGRTFRLSAPIPASALERQNLVTVAWNGRSGATGPFVALRGESTLYLPREYVVELPDLALLRNGFYPFSLRADLSEAVVGVSGSEDSVPALCELAVLLGRLLPSDRFLFRVATLPQAVASGGSDAILLEAGDGPGLLPAPDVKRLPRGEALGRLPFVQELESPRGDGRYFLRLRAPTPALLRAAVRGLGEPSVLQRLRGDTAFLAAEGPLAFQLGQRRTLAEISYLTRLQAWLRAHWLALPLVLAGVSSLLFMGLRLALEHRRASRRA
ncbi:MAG TPA: cellulose biosynthesis cyclic di-GMP-binding regulatory protein BcsB [Vicinamibacteria bacterium]|nr:cellulose biosynthesis cyclic di-GMP-binding regulatory protein BcsB [Vicinamibacteria bacterium]